MKKENSGDVFLVLKFKNKNKEKIGNSYNSNEYNDEFVIETKELNLWYEDNHALKNINMKFRKNIS